MRPAGELEGQATESASRFAIDELRLGSYLEAQGFGLKGLRACGWGPRARGRTPLRSRRAARAPGRIRKFSTGQSNPTFRLDAASGSYVLRSKPSGRLIRSAHMIEREFRVLRALAATDVPVPRVHHYCEDAAVMGAPFYVMDFVEGRVYNDATLPEVDPGARRAMYRSALATLVRIHSVDLGAVGMSDFGRHGGYYARQVKRVRRAGGDARRRFRSPPLSILAPATQRSLHRRPCSGHPSPPAGGCDGAAGERGGSAAAAPGDRAGVEPCQPPTRPSHAGARRLQGEASVRRR